jgi:hypothetical protein
MMRLGMPARTGSRAIAIKMAANWRGEARLSLLRPEWLTSSKPVQST